jgi:hypothetical protein
MVPPHRDLFFTLVNQAEILECKLWVKDFNLLSVKFSAPTFSLPDLHRRHLREIMPVKTQSHEELLSIVGRIGTLLIGVHRGS